MHGRGRIAVEGIGRTMSSEDFLRILAGVTGFGVKDWKNRNTAPVVLG